MKFIVKNANNQSINNWLVLDLDRARLPW